MGTGALTLPDDDDDDDDDDEYDECYDDIDRFPAYLLSFPTNC